MKAKIHTELRCGECNGMMQYHNETMVRCTNIKCDQRNVEYEVPTIDLVKAGQKKVKRGRKAAED